ncbi:hypothetical protein EDB83DRAFT_1359089 [Lactarius deliciosus]|nr:hypothetical protein EDB83DRAFT_1359089 [Lactarius deliciosus]
MRLPSPASRSVSLPSQHNQGQPYQPNFPSGPLRQGQNGNPSAPPRSPVYTRPMANGQNGGVGVSGGRPQAGSGGASTGPAPAAMPSPRLTPHCASWPTQWSASPPGHVARLLLSPPVCSWRTSRPVLPATMAWSSYPSTPAAPATPPTECRSTIRGSAYVTTKSAHTTTASSKYPYAVACHSTYSSSTPPIRSPSTIIRHLTAAHPFYSQSSDISQCQCWCICPRKKDFNQASFRTGGQSRYIEARASSSRSSRSSCSTLSSVRQKGHQATYPH